MAMAAGLAVMVTAAFLVVHLVNRPATETRPEIVTAPLPGSLWNVAGVQNVSVPVVAGEVPVLFPAGGGGGQRRTVVITPEGVDNALIIPVTNLQYQ